MNERACMQQRILFVSIVRADKSISGLGLRFVGLWRHLRENRPEVEVFLLTNNSLREASLGGLSDPNLFSFEDRGRFYVAKRLLVGLWLLWLCWRLRITSVHLTAGGADYVRLLSPVFRLLSMKVCTTFASASLDVTTGGDPKGRQVLESILRNARNLDVLNPTHTLPQFSYQKFVSPCSFPWALAGHKVPNLSDKPARERLIVFSGSFAPWKNPLLALEGFASFLAANPNSKDSRLVLIGKGPLEPQVRQLADEINSKFGRPAVFFGDPGSSIDYLSRSRIFLSLQFPDNYPSQSLMEAMLLGNHIVATDVGDTQMMVRPELNNRLVPVSASAVGQALEQLLAVETINTENRELILREHSVARFADYFLHMHQNLVV